MNEPKGFQEFLALYPGARLFPDVLGTYVHVPNITLPSADIRIIREGLLCPFQYAGYTTRLFLDQPILGKGANWTVHQILSRTWHTWSWNNVVADSPLLEILANHLRAFQ